MKTNEINLLTVNELKQSNEVIKQLELEDSKNTLMKDLRMMIDKLNTKESLSNYMKVIHILEDFHISLLTLANQCYKENLDDTALEYFEKDKEISELLNNYRNMCHFYREKKKISTMTNGLYCNFIYNLDN